MKKTPFPAIVIIALLLAVLGGMIWSSVIGRGKRAAQGARTNGIEHF